MTAQPSTTPGETEPRLPGKPIMPLLSLRRHWLKSLILFTLVAGIGLPVAWVKGKARYYAEAVIQINFRYAPNLRTVQEIETQSDTQYQRFVAQQTRMITRYEGVKSALESLGEQRSRWQLPDETERHAVQRLTWALQIKAVHNTYLVTIGLEHEEPDLIPLLVNPIVESYIEAARQDIFYGETIRLENLDARRQEIESSIAQLSSQLEERAQRLGLITFEEGLSNPYDRVLLDLTSELSRARQKRVTAEAELEAMRGKHERLLKLSLEAEAQKMTASDRALGDLRAYLYQRRAQLVQTMSGLKPNHSGRQAAEREIEQINAEILQATADKQAEMEAILKERRRAEMRSEVAEYEAKVEEARRIEQALAAHVAERTQEVDAFTRLYNEGLGAQEQLNRLRRQLTLILDRIDEIKTEQNAPGYVRLISLAEVPELPVSGGRKKLFILFLVAASGLALALPLALDFLDNRIRTPIDLHRVAGFAPSSWLPEICNQEAKVLFDQQMERLAIAVFRDLDRHGQACAFFVTAALPGAGRTFVARQLADQLQRLGIDTLVLSCDPSHAPAISAVAPQDSDLAQQSSLGQPRHVQEPTLSDLEPSTSERPPRPGLSELVAGVAELEQAIMRRGPDRADWIEPGLAKNPEEIDNILRLQDILTQINKDYRLVLVDGPAILTSATAEAIAGICHGCLMIVPAIETPVKPLKRALSIIERAAPEVVGTVLNRAPFFAGGGYYRALAESLAGDRANPTDAANSERQRLHG